MYIYQLLDRLIELYFQKQQPRMARIAAGMESKYADADAQAAGGSDDGQGLPGWEAKSFGFQTLVMMLIMLVVFGVLCIVLVLLAFLVGDGDLAGVQIFLVFFVLCLVMCLLSKYQSGFVIYAPQWCYVERKGKGQAFAFSEVRQMRVSGDLTLIYEDVSGKDRRAVIPLQSRQYLDFMKFIETYHPRLVRGIPPQVYEKARRKHGGAWGNKM